VSGSLMGSMLSPSRPTVSAQPSPPERSGRHQKRR
jgi:hypothetical protein